MSQSQPTFSLRVPRTLLFGWDVLQKLKANDPIIVRSSAEAIPLLVNGERPLSAQSYSDSAWEAKLKGEPLEISYPEEGVVVSHDYTGILKSAPHPNAAKLLVDFIISKEGQEVFRAADYITAHPGVPALEPTLKPKEGKFRVHFFTPEEADELMPKWKAVFDDLFR